MAPTTKIVADALADGTQAVGWAKFISTVGVTSILTLGGAYWMANYVVTNQLRMLEKLDVITNQNVALAQTIEARTTASQRNDEEFMFYARTVCALLTEINKSKASVCVPDPPSRVVR